MHLDHDVFFFLKMAANQIKNGDWMQDQMLKDDLSGYVWQNWKKVITLARRLQYFDIKFTDYEGVLRKLRPSKTKT